MAHNALLIGGNTGFGLESARRLTAAGWSVTAAVRDPGPLPSLRVSTQPFDAEDVPTLQLPDTLHGLIYCPGTINLKPFHRLTAADFQRDFQINCLAAAQVIQPTLDGQRNPDPTGRGVPRNAEPLLRTLSKRVQISARSENKS